MQAELQKRFPYFILFGLLIISLAVVFAFSGTYDTGDSLMHFQFAHWAYSNPKNLLDHWAKPFFTLLASVFAYFGFGGMKVLQCLMLFGTGFFTWKIGQRLEFKYAWIAAIFTSAAPEVFRAQMSGLTEPMFAFFLAFGIYLLLDEREILGALILSVLPFIRTEGFLVLPAFGIFLLVFQRNWKANLALATATLIYSLIGGIVFGDFLWIWTQNPYAGGRENYGIGNYAHFFEKYILIVGVPLYALQILGHLAIPVQLFRKQITYPKAFFLCILLPFWIYFGAHVYFWATGTGHSMGMHRVLIAIVPLGTIIAVLGLEMLLSFFSGKATIFGKVLLGLIIAYVLIFPFSANNAALDFKELQTYPDQTLMANAADWAKLNGYSDRIVWSAFPAAAFYLDINPFDQEKYRAIDGIDHGYVPIGSLIIWDNWFGRVEGGITPGFLKDNEFRFKPLMDFKETVGEKEYEVRLFEKVDGIKPE